MSGKPTLLFSYLDWYLIYLERLPREEMVVINAWRAPWCFSQRPAGFSPSPVQYSSSGSHSIGSIHPVIWGLTLYTRLTWWIGGEQVNRAPSGGPPQALTLGSCWCFNPSDFTLLLVHLGTLVTRKFTRIWKFHSSPITSEL